MRMRFLVHQLRDVLEVAARPRLFVDPCNAFVGNY